MTAANLHKVVTANSGVKPSSASSSPSPSPARANKDIPNPQQGMADPAASVSANTAGAATSNTACTSPLTVTSLEAAVTAAATAHTAAVPQVVSQVVPAMHPQQQPPQPQSKPASSAVVESMLENLSLNQPLPGSPPAMPIRPAEEKKMRLRTPPTERDSRKLFVGGLPTDVTDREFLNFFQHYGEVIDSVVIIDRITKRSRGFGFVTFATEKYANALLTAIPGKTGYVVINGKQCEVKASTPKADDGTYKRGNHHHHHHHHGATGMWKSDLPRHDGHRGFVPRHPINNVVSRGATMMKQQAMMQQQLPRGGKHFSIDNEFNGDVDGRNFDQLYQPSPQMNPSYHSMYGRGMSSTNLPMYQYNQNVYTSGTPSSYIYPNFVGGAGASGASPSSYDSSFTSTAPGQGYAPYGSAPYNPYMGQYANQYSNNNSSMPPSMAMEQPTGHTNNSGYNAEGALSPGGEEENYQPYSQPYTDDGNYGHNDAVDQYD